VKKARLEGFVFRRDRPIRTVKTAAQSLQAPLPEPAVPGSSTSTSQCLDGPPKIQTSQLGDELRDGRIRGFTKPAAAYGGHLTGLDLQGPGPAGMQTPDSLPETRSDGNQGQSNLREPRRFHMSRSAAPSAARSFVTGVPNRKQAAIFIERRQPAKHTNKLLGEALSTKASQISLNTQNQEASAESAVTKLQGPVSTPPLTPIKPKAQPPLRNIRQASGKVITSSASEAELAEAMQAYTLDNIGRALAEASTPVRKAPASPFVPRSSSSRFKPKAPALRYHERHPEDPTAAVPQMEPEVEMEVEDDDSEYIIDTYIRVPAHLVSSEESIGNAGLLVLDAQSDVDEFYNDDSDDDSEIYDEEEDENGKRHVFVPAY